LGSTQPERASRLTACLKARYAQRTGLPYHTSVTPDMSSYHAFSEIDPDTPAAIIETGFMGGDRDMLTGHPDVVADGIVAGVRCFLERR
jgi:N-acetylmuramoyl-L-alanine amidase